MVDTPVTDAIILKVEARWPANVSDQVVDDVTMALRLALQAYGAMSIRIQRQLPEVRDGRS